MAEECPISILIVDDHPLLRQGIHLALATHPDLCVVGEASDGEEALERIASLQPDVVVLDLDLPKRDGFSIVRQLNLSKASAAIVILTLHTGADLVFEALALGIRGYILKSSAAIDVAEAVRRVAGGGSYLSEDVQRTIEKGRAGNAYPEALQQLTPLEIKLVREISQGVTTREIAAALDLSVRTVENYRTVICAKLNLTGPNALLRYALSQRRYLLR